MKLLVESSEDIQSVIEENADGEKSHFLSGIFMQAEQTNKNGRIYTLPILEKETNRYIDEKVKTQRALGELILSILLYFHLAHNFLIDLR